MDSELQLLARQGAGAEARGEYADTRSATVRSIALELAQLLVSHSR
ncbi:MAG TPA: hypothetical protein VFF73_32055 [Planctomycetota bacterium]|nr:hypothetical protein [Planctomycetota bacterium]